MTKGEATDLEWSLYKQVVDLKDQLVQTGIKDRNGDMIRFGDTLRFADKVEWYTPEYWVRVNMGVMSSNDALNEIDKKPYHELKVESVQDYEWILSSDIQEFWEIIKS